MLKKACLISNIMLLLAIAAIIAVTAASRDRFEPNTDTDAGSVIEIKKEAPEPLYFVKDTGGIIGVYRYRDTTACRIINVDVSGLPEEDRRLLEKGVLLYSDEELHFFLEDYDTD